MVYPLDKYVDVMLQLDISPLQILFCQIIYERRHHLLYRIANEGQIFPKTALNDLIEKGYVIDTNPDPNNVFADHFQVTDKFVDAFYQASPEDGEEFWNAYPPFMTIDGKKIPTKACNKEELIAWYHKNTGAKHNHRKVMDALAYARDNKLISMRIDKWLHSEAFVDIWDIMRTRPSQELPHDTIL